VTAVATVAALLVGVAFHQPRWGIWAFAGAFTSFYVDDQPFRARARRLALVALGLAAAEALGALATVWWLMAVGLAAAGVAATYLAGRTRLPLPAGFMFLLVACISAAVPNVPQTPERVAFALVGGAIAWLVGMAGWLVDRRGPETRKVRGAYMDLAAFLGTTPGSGEEPVRQADAAAAWRTAARALAGPPGRDPARARLAFLVDRGERMLLAAAAARAATDRPLDPAWASFVRALAGVVGTEGPVPSPPPAADPGAADAGLAAIAADTVATLAHGPAAIAQAVAGGTARRPAAQAPPEPPMLRQAALRLGLAVGLSVVVAHALGAAHPYWAPLTVAAVLQGHTVRMVTQRAVDRVLGTLAGLALVAVILGFTRPGAPAVMAMVVVLQAAMRVLMVKNYGLAVAPMTAFALLIVHASSPAAPSGLEIGRLWDTLLGVALALGAAYLLWARSASHRLPGQIARALDLEGSLFARVADRSAAGAGAQVADLERRLVELDEVARDALAEVPRSRAAHRLWPAVAAVQRLGYALVAGARGVASLGETDAGADRGAFERLAGAARGGGAGRDVGLAENAATGPVGRQLRAVAVALGPRP